MRGLPGGLQRPLILLVAATGSLIAIAVLVGAVRGLPLVAAA